MVMFYFDYTFRDFQSSTPPWPGCIRICSCGTVACINSNPLSYMSCPDGVGLTDGEQPGVPMGVSSAGARSYSGGVPASIKLNLSERRGDGEIIGGFD